jgi:hypothetical protein
MVLLLKARVKETSVSTGSGTIDLDGAVSGFRTFVSAFGTAGKCYYTIIHGTAWEQGIGTVTAGSPDTISRDICLGSSSADALLTLGAGTKTVFCDAPPQAYMDPEDRVLMTRLDRVAPGTFVTITGTAYYVYVGKTVRPLTAAFVEAHMTVAGSGAQTAEMGLFSTPLAPNKAGQTLTKIVATGTVDTLTATVAVKRNTASFATAIPVGTHLWAGIRTALATTQPTFTGLTGDHSQGHILTTTGQGVLTGLTTTAGGLVTLGTATVCPELRVTLD